PVQRTAFPSLPTRRSSDLAGRDLVGSREAFIGLRVAARRLVGSGGGGLGFGRLRLIEREHRILERGFDGRKGEGRRIRFGIGGLDRKSTRLNSSHVKISYA